MDGSSDFCTASLTREPWQIIGILFGSNFYPSDRSRRPDRVARVA
jgi:hypothetical protein